MHDSASLPEEITAIWFQELSSSKETFVLIMELGCVLQRPACFAAGSSVVWCGGDRELLGWVLDMNSKVS